MHCVTDRQQRRVCLPDGPLRISCDDILCFESMLTLGESSKVVQMRGTDAPWVHLDPRIPLIARFDEPSVEQMLVDKIDAAFVYPSGGALERYQRAGIAALVGQSTARDATSLEAFLAGQKDSLRLYGAVMGPKAMKRAEVWARYVDRQVEFVSSRVRSLAPKERKSAYYVRGPDALSSHGSRTCTFWYAQLAGADLVTALVPAVGRGAISAEQLIVWDPEVIFVGRLYSSELLYRDPRFQNLRAVISGSVFLMPSGVFFWDGGPESVLLMLWIAKVVHPDLFADLDMEDTVRDYYARFYGLGLDDRSVENMLAGLGTDGRRTVTRNN